MVSVEGQVVEVSDRFIYLESDEALKLAFTDALVSHPPHWENKMTEYGLKII